MNLIVAIGLAMALEGAAYALFPDVMKRAAAALFALGERQVRLAGAATFTIGAVVVLLTMGLS
ncbi:MAG: DUF2065 domain-containing protein [Pacificimonas sp.]